MPAGTMLRTTWGQVDATSLSDFSGILTDNVTNNQVILWLLAQRGGIVTRRGKTIVEPLIMEDNASVHWYSGYDPLDLTNTEGIFAAEYAWKQLAGVAQLSGLEAFQNSGDGQIIDLWDAKGDQLALTMKRRVNTAIPLDGSADTGRALIGLQSAVPFDGTTGVYGTLDRATNPNWRNYYFGTPGAAASGGEIASAAGGPVAADVDILFRGLRRMILGTTAGGDGLDLVMMTQYAYEVLLFGLESKQQLVRGPDRVDAQMAQAGFENVVYMGVPHTWDADMFPNTTGAGAATTGQGTVGLNLDYAKAVFGEGYEFTFGDPTQPDNQDVNMMKCLAYLNMVFSNLKRQGRTNFTKTN